MSNISFTNQAWGNYCYWQKQDRKTLKKIYGVDEQMRPIDLYIKFQIVGLKLFNVKDIMINKIEKS